MTTETTTTVPYHIQARSLGADVGAIRKRFKKCRRYSNLAATDITAVWDYRSAGLNVEQARICIQKWCHSAYRIKPFEPETGRYLSIQRDVTLTRKNYAETVSWIQDIGLCHSENKPAWNNGFVRFQVGQRTIITEYFEDVTWPDRNGKSSRWPESTKRYYTSYLLRADYERPPTAKEVQAQKIGCSKVFHLREFAAEKHYNHDLRGHWWARVITELLGVQFVHLYSMIPPEKPPVRCYKIVEMSDSGLRSVYKPDFGYALNTWVEDEAHENHGGGIYAYLEKNTAVCQAKNNSIFSDADGKHLVLCECEAKGRSIEYAHDKIAFSALRIIRVLETVLS